MPFVCWQTTHQRPRIFSRCTAEADSGHLAGAGAHSYSEGDTTDGSEEAERFKAQMPPIPAR